MAEVNPPAQTSAAVPAVAKEAPRNAPEGTTVHVHPSVPSGTITTFHVPSKQPGRQRKVGGRKKTLSFPVATTPAASRPTAKGKKAWWVV